MSEQIGNISSNLLEKALDKLMEPAIRAINACSDLYAVEVANALASKAFDVRHKPSRSDSFFEDAAIFIITRDIDTGLRLKLNHDRNIAMCDKFLLCTAGADAASQSAVWLRSEALLAMGEAIMATAPGRLFSARCEVAVALKHVKQLRETIAEKFMRLATSRAAEHTKERVGVNYEVAHHQAIQGIYTAIDRYSGERGALASYIELWIKQALLDKTNLQEGAALDIGSSGGVNDNRATFLERHSTAAVSIDAEGVGDLLATDDSDGYANRHAEHTRALSALAALRPVLRSTGESLRYELNNRERANMLRLN